MKSTSIFKNQFTALLFLFLLFQYQGNAQTEYLVVSTYTDNSVLRFEESTGIQASDLAPPGHGGLDDAAGIHSGNDGNFYVVSQLGDEVAVFEGANASFIRSIPTDNVPSCLILSNAGTLLVSEVSTDHISEFNVTTGVRIGTWNTGGTLLNPTAMQYGYDGNLYVSCNQNHKVARFDASTGVFIDNFVPTGSGGLNKPGDLRFHTDGYLYVSSRNTNEVLRYDGTTGAFTDVFITAGLGGLSDPIGLFFRSNGNLLVASFATNQVLEYDQNGSYLGVFHSGNNTVYMTTHSMTEPEPNLIVNPDCELDPSTNGWTIANGFWQKRNSANPYSNLGSGYFFAGATPGTAELYQDIDVSDDAGYIDAENLQYDFQGYQRSFSQNPPDGSQIIVEYRDLNGNVLETFDTGEQTNTSFWQKATDSRVAPVGTRIIRIRLFSHKHNSSNNDGYSDNLSLTKTYLGGPLPIDWEVFSAILLGKEVQLNWSTASESNNRLFQIERSTDAINWDVIGELPAMNFLDGYDYESFDRQPKSGLSYYRIRQLDFDGTASFSKVESVWMENNIPDLEVYPNPANEILYVENVGLGNAHLNIYNSLGQSVYPSINKHEGRWEIMIGDLPKGIYFLKYGERVVQFVKA